MRMRFKFESTDRPTTVAALFLYFCTSCADGLMVPFFSLWALNEGGIPVALIGILFACYAGGEIIATPFLGGIADRIGRRPILITSLLGVAAGFIALFFVHGTILCAAVLLWTGIFECVLHPTIGAVIADVTPPKEQRHLFSIARVSSNMGRVIGPALGALIADYSLRTVFLSGGVVLLLGAAVAAIFLAETLTRSDNEGADDDEGFSALKPIIVDAKLRNLLFWVLLFALSSSWIEAVIPLFSQASGILTAFGVGMLFTYGAILVVIGQMFVSRHVELWSAGTLTVSAGVVLASGFVVLAAWPTVGAMVIAVSLFSLGDMLIGPMIPTEINRLAPTHKRASYMAAASVANDLRDTVGPATGTALFALAPALPWMLGTPLVLFASIGLGITLVRQKVHGSELGKIELPNL